MIMAHSEIIFRPRPPVAADYQRLFETTGRRTGNADADDLRLQADHLIRLKRRGAADVPLIAGFISVSGVTDLWKSLGLLVY
jgi:hypothetical protein